MKHEKRENVAKIFADAKAALCKLRFKKLICVIAGIGVLAVGLHIWSSMPAAAEELTIPTDYRVGYEIANLDNLENGGSFNGILCKDKVNKVFTLLFSDDVNGLVTLARISQNSSLDGYTFEIALGGSVILDVKYGEDGKAISDGSFFGIGNDANPFKGKIVIGGSADTSIAIGEKSWRFLFNNLSNKAEIVSSGNYYLYSSYVDQNESPQEADSFVFCRRLTVTDQNAPLVISGFRFGATAESGKSGALVRGDGPTAVFACEVKKGGADSFSVDLSSSLTSGTYVVESNAYDAGGLIAAVEADINATIGLPYSLSFKVKAGGEQKNAGILIGSNNGNVTFVAGTKNTENAFIFTGELNATGSTGLIGANQAGSQAKLSEKVIIDGLKASGLRAGGIAGTGKGPITVKAAEIKNSTFTRIDLYESGRLGGAIGSVDQIEGGLRVEDGGSVQLLNNTFSASKDCFIGGYIGYLKTSGEAVENITVCNTVITGGGSSSDKLGGYIGSLDTSGDFSVALENSIDSSFTFKGTKAGICGGIIGEVSSDLQNTVLLKGKEPSDGTVKCTVEASGAKVGGLVGRVAKGYLKIDRLSVDNDIVRASSAADLAGEINTGAMLDVGKITLTEAKGSVLVGKTGQGSVVRLSGNITDNSSSVLNLVYEQDASLIYKENGCEYRVKPSVYSVNNDIGNYGQVVRNDTLKVLNFDTGTHKVSLASPLDSSGDISVNSAADFAKLAVTFHTKGAISGVEGFTADNFESLFGKNIKLTADILLENTGIEQLTPSIDATKPFTGSLNGNNRTVTLAIGENIFGDNVSVKAGTNNKRTSLGLFASLYNATVINVKTYGKISLCLPDENQYVGSLAAKANGTLTFNNCEVNTAITVENGVSKKSKNTYLYVGGTVGYIGDTASLSVTGCKLNANITDSTDLSGYTPENNKLSLGGFSGYAYYTGTKQIDFQNNIIGTIIKKAGSYANLKLGGFIGELKCSDYVTANLRGTKAENVNLTATKATVSAGGILGYSFDKCHIILNGAYKGTVNTGSASLGGLLYTMNGRLTVESGFSVTGTSLTSTGDLKGLLLADGKTALVTVEANPSGFNGVTADGFDLFVGENIEEYTSVNVAASGGIVTVETGGTLGKLPQSSAWYALINARPNTKTRYYFNIAGLKNENVSETISGAAELLYWHIYDYAQALPDYVKTEFFKTAVNNITSVTADIDMTDYCLYPTEKESVRIDFNGHKLTFGRTAPVNAQNQFFGLQAGLLSDINDGGADTAVNISHIKLGGKVSHLGGDLGSGALICGTAGGSNVNNNRYDVKLTLSDITLSGLAVETADYRPLLINRIASYVEASVSGIKQENYTKRSAASSLIGKGGMLEGSTPSSFIKMTFNNIVLDGEKSTTVFTRASLFDDVLYESGSGSFIYNFNFAEDWGEALEHQVTYGAELYLNEDQRTYFDKNIPVRPDSVPNETSELYQFQNNYLPYVYTGYVLADGKTNLNLSVNRKGADLIEGYGTYLNPYIIKYAKQLEYVSKLLSGNNEPFSDGWQINFPKGDWSSLSTLDLTAYDTVRAESGNLSNTDKSKQLSREVLVSYLSGAYFKLAEDLNISSGYAGLGSATYPFHGVIHGNGNTVTMSSTDTAIGAYGYGFINVANGCAVYDLTIKYDSIVLSSDEFTEEQTQTSHPTDNTLKTALPHFGGAIAWVVGGDNLLDTVTVSAVDTAISVTPGACHTVCGGYVGIISGGGVLLSGLKEDLNLNDSKHLYHNNYIGRVLEGYAIAIDGKTYNNSKVLSGLNESRADFIIPAIAKAELIGHNKGFSSDTFTLENSQDLLLFSFGINSGAFAGNNGYGYGKTSLSRCRDYSYVGAESAADVTDGKYIDDTNKTSILLKYFGINTQTDLRNTSTGLNLKLIGTEYDMRGYGNAFRAMSGVYGNSPTYKIVFFGNDSGTATVTLNMDMLQYAASNAALYEADSIQCYGLFGRLTDNISLQNLVLKGKVSLSLIDKDNSALETDLFTGANNTGSRSVGGIIGYSGAAGEFGKVSLEELTVISPDICGGFVGLQSGNLTVNNCAYNSSTIKGKRYTGGVVGYVGNGKVEVVTLSALNSVIETRIDMSTAVPASINFASGGVIGRLEGGSGATLTDCKLTKTAVVFVTNIYKTSENAGAGGLIGIAKKNVTATNCKVDGCVIFSLSSFSGVKFPDELSGNIDILTNDLKNNIVYKGNKQISANILAWVLEQSNRLGSGYSIGAAGGIIGTTNTEFSLDSCTVSSESAPTVIIGFDNTAGLVGEQRNTVAVTAKISNCTVSADSHDMYILAATRAAGIVAYRHNKNDNNATYILDDVRVIGTAEHPVRILNYNYSPGDAGGFFGDLSRVNLTVNNGCVSNCIIGGNRAAGIYCTSSSSSTSTVNLKNVHVSSNLIYSKNSSYMAGGILGEFAYNNMTVNVDINGAYVGKNHIVGVSGAGALVGKLNTNATLSAKYVILDDNVIRKIKTAKVSNFTFAANSLADGAAANALFALNNTDFTNVGLIAGNNAGKVTAIAVSCSDADAGDIKQKNFGAGAGTGTVVYAAYGAWVPYKLGGLTPQEAIKMMNFNASVNGADYLLYGDSVTDGTPNTIYRLNWWPYKDSNFTLGETAITKLIGLVNGITENRELPLFCLNEKTDETMKGYLNMLTGGGFGDALNTGSNVSVSVVSKRYRLGDNGNLEDLGTDGSVVYRDGKFSAGVYDSLEGDSKTLTVLSITYNDVYTMHLAIYYHRSVNLKTFVVPLEGEQYYLPSFLSFASEPDGSLRTNVSFGKPFTMYVEYNYNDLAMTLENIDNFDKQIELTQSNGVSDESARIESGTEFVLIDLNSATPAGYSYYTLVLDKDERFINFNSFKNGETEFGHIPLTDLQTLAHLSENRVCKDTSDCVYTEKYLLVVFPVQNKTDSAITYNMKAVIDEEQRQETNIAVKRLKEVYGQVSVWSSPEVTQAADYCENLTEFSNLADKPIKMQVKTTVSFAEGYVTAINSQHGGVYGTHILRLKNPSNQYVELPMRTIVKVETKSGDEIYKCELADAASQIRFSVGNLLSKGVTDNKVEMDYKITLDFSNVNQNDFNNAFAVSKDSFKFNLVDSFYLSADSNLLGSGPWDANKEYQVEINNGIKLAVVPTDNRHLGINLLKPEDETNNGKIDFSVIARFDAFAGKTFNDATVTFSVSKKVYENGDYKYVDITAADPIKWEISKDDSVIGSDTLTVTDNECNGTYRLAVDVGQGYKEADLTNYRLNVMITSTADDNTTVNASDYFVFLLCKLDTDPAS